MWTNIKIVRFWFILYDLLSIKKICILGQFTVKKYSKNLGTFLLFILTIKILYANIISELRKQEGYEDDKFNNF